MRKYDMNDIENDISHNAVSVYGQESTMDEFPILKAFQEYIDAEQAKARKRMLGLSIFFILLLVVIVIAFAVVVMLFINRNQSLSDRLLDIALREKLPAQPVVTVQSPAENLDVMLDSEVALSVYRYPTDKADYSFEVILKNTGEDINLRVTLQAQDSELELESYSHVYPPDLDRTQRITVNIPDTRLYICRVYQNGEATETFEIGEEP